MLSPTQFDIAQLGELDGPLGSYGDPGPVGVGWQGTGMLGARAEIPSSAGVE
jgi:hypothetical protein